MRRSLYIALSVITLASARAFAYPGHTTANFLKIGVGPRAVAMGEAYTAVADDVSAIHYNPAGLATLLRQEACFMHSEFLPGVQHEWGAYAYPHAKLGTMAASYTFLSVKSFDSYDELDRPTGEVGASDMAASVAFAREFGKTQRLAFGVNAKYISSRLSSYRARGGALDGGLMWYSDEYGTWRVGVAVRNLGNKMKFIEEEFFLPASAHAGIAYTSPLPHPWNDLHWTGTVEVAGSYDRDPYMAGGLELALPLEIYLRAGYRQNQDIGLGVSGGFGVRSLEKAFAGDWWPEMTLDYAFVDFGALDHTHRISVTLRFGPNKYGSYTTPVRAEDLRFY